MKSSKKSSKTSIRENELEVYCRLRPTNNPECMEMISPTVLAVYIPESSVYYQSVGKEKHFSFKEIFGLKANQQQVFKRVGEPLVKGLLEGQNGLLFAYGVTGSGKTYTMTGNNKSAGIMTRCIQVLFKTIGDKQAEKYVFKPDKFNSFDVQTQKDAKIEQMRETKKLAKTPSIESNLPTLCESELESVDGLDEQKIYAVFVTYVEIYNNYVYDLLDEQKTPQSKIIREDYNHNMYVHGVTEVEVKSPSEVMLLFEKGKMRRRVGYTHLNSESSRSHAIFTLRLVQTAQDVGDTGKQEIIISQLSLVDLAGSERSAKNVSGIRLKEATNINSSLLNLRLCLYILNENYKSGENNPVPYRESKLTHLFKMYFERGGLVRMLVCVNPSIQEFEESFNVLKFAQLSAEVQIVKGEQQKINVEMRPPKIPSSAKQTKPLRTQRPKLPCFVKHDINNKQLDTCINIPPVTPVTPHTPHTPLTSFTPFTHRTQNLAFSNKNLVFEQLKDIPKFDITSFDDVDKLKCIREHLEERIEKRHELTQKLKEFAFQIRNEFETKLDTYSTANLELKFYRDKDREQEQKWGAYELKLSEIQKDNEQLQLTIQQKNEQIYNMQLALNEYGALTEQMKLDNEKQKSIYMKKLKKQYDMLTSNTSSDKGEKRKLQQVVDLPELNLSNKRRTDSSFTTTNSQHDVNINRHPLSNVDLNIPSTSYAASCYISPQSKTEKRRQSIRRRSKSVENTSGVWIEHHSGVATDQFKRSLLRPHGNLKKVLELKASDIRKPATTHYCLVTQEPDTEGELETQVIKGDVIPTYGGGAQVVFEDVEILSKRSPSKLRYRSCSP